MCELMLCKCKLLLNRELKQSSFCETHIFGNWTFCILGQWFNPIIFLANRPYKI